MASCLELRVLQQKVLKSFQMLLYQLLKMKATYFWKIHVYIEFGKVLD